MGWLVPKVFSTKRRAFAAVTESGSVEVGTLSELGEEGAGSLGDMDLPLPFDSCDPGVWG
jgi:hypothetical protein